LKDWPIVSVGAWQAVVLLVGNVHWYEFLDSYVRDRVLRSVKTRVKQCE